MKLPFLPMIKLTESSFTTNLTWALTLSLEIGSYIEKSLLRVYDLTATFSTSSTEDENFSRELYIFMQARATYLGDPLI